MPQNFVNDSIKKTKTNKGGFNWMNLVNLGLRLMLSTLNGGSGSGIDKSDSASGPSAGNSAMQVNKTNN